jgi:hypothetical protein
MALIAAFSSKMLCMFFWIPSASPQALSNLVEFLQTRFSALELAPQDM